MNKLLSFLIFILSVGSILSQDGNQIFIVDGTKTFPVPAFLREGTYYLSLKDFADKSQINYYYNQSSKKIELKNDNYLLKVSSRNPFIVITDRRKNSQEVYQLTTSTYYVADKIFIPLKYSVNVLQKFLGTTLKYEAPNKLILMRGSIQTDVSEIKSDSKFDVTGLEIDEKANGTLVRLKSNKRIPSYASSFKDGVLTLIFRKVNADVSNTGFEGTGGVVKKIQSRNVGNDLELKIFVGPEYTTNEVINVEKSNDILITIHNKLFVKTDKSPKKEKWEFDVIVIDPGHGGKDAGAIGVNGVKEKDVNLGIALELGKLIQSRMTDVKVVFTRKDDTFIDLYKRGKIANDKNGKLFISIHCNSTPKKPTDANGFEVYLLRPGRTKEAIAIAEFENSVIQYEENPQRYQKLTDENFILVSMAQSAYMRYSEKFAELLHNEFTKHPKIISRGVKQAGFYVLVGASMPNVLIETGFLSNPSDAKYLASKSGQKEMAAYIFEAIKKYRDHYESEMKAN
ncbi:MAG: N-acetylmuramoyl-L-alanine amidase [Ignavibacterium sp.]|jgi:N-acetylmuramoyl-L-alanine amidase|uniref:N-acetylmuramoyl-L-alanine amidase family protein n=1 Tax=Ignavibacterium sp. TaxID=2651167 RepID=UPI00329893FF